MCLSRWQAQASTANPSPLPYPLQCLALHVAQQLCDTHTACLSGSWSVIARSCLLMHSEFLSATCGFPACWMCYPLTAECMRMVHLPLHMQTDIEKPPTSHIGVGGQEQLLAGEAGQAASPQDEQQVHCDLQEAEEEEGGRCLYNRSHFSRSANRRKEYLHSHDKHSLPTRLPWPHHPCTWCVSKGMALRDSLGQQSSLQTGKGDLEESAVAKPAGECRRCPQTRGREALGAWARKLLGLQSGL